MPTFYKIDPNGRYIVLIKVPEGTPQEVALETSRKVQDLLLEWEKGEQKFLVISFLDGIEVTLEKIPDGNSSVRKQVNEAIVEVFETGRT